MKLGIFAKTFPGTTPLAVLQAAASAGYASVQYNMACSGLGALPVAVTAEVAQAVREASAATGVEIAAISATYNMTHPDLARRRAGRDSLAAIAGRAHAMGSNLLTVCSGSLDAQDQWRHHPDNDTPAAWARMLDEFRALIEIADQYDIQIGVEPELANIVSSAERARKLIDSLGSDRIRIVLDPANLAEVAHSDDRRRVIANAVNLLADRIVMAHAKDRHADGSFATAGQGVIDFPHFLGALAAVGFGGSLVTHGLADHEAAGVATFLKAAMA
ncbi:MAG: sugar phosphate isomerase/epimerase [Alphaproteobacteria bacterium HGW-Alphaproteobacteria-6]|nr:MAG: sugar phosphate isomerase/epimerase [Alphaproteobacteria bacterium HGW-Alphaproteobacteria-6]